MSRDVSADLCHVGCARMAGQRPNKRSISPVSVGGEIARAVFMGPGFPPSNPVPRLLFALLAPSVEDRQPMMPGYVHCRSKFLHRHRGKVTSSDPPQSISPRYSIYIAQNSISNIQRHQNYNELCKI